MADVYEIARAGLELAEKATPGEWTVDRGDEWTEDYPLDITLRGPAHERDGFDGTATCEIAKMSGGGLPSMDLNAALIAHAGTHYAALCRAVIEAEQTRLAQKAVVEAAVAMVEDDSTSATLTFNRLARAVRAMKEQTR